MSVRQSLASWGRKYFDLNKTDGKQYVLKDGELAQLVAPSSAPTLSQIAQEILGAAPTHRLPSQLQYLPGEGRINRIFSPIPVTTAITTAYLGTLAEIGWRVADTGSTGAGATRPLTNQPLLGLNTGTTATGTSNLSGTSAANPVAPNIGDFTAASVDPVVQGNIAGWVTRLSFALPSLSTSAQEYNLRLAGGLGTPGASTASIGEFTLRYTRTQSTNWRLFYMNDAFTSVFVDTGVAVANTLLEFVTYVIRTGVGAYTIHWGLRNDGASSYLASGSITNSVLSTTYWAEGTTSIAALLGGTIANITATVGTTSKSVRISGFQQCILLSPP